MAYFKEIATAVGTLACAVGIGFVMQSGETAKARYDDGGKPTLQPVNTNDVTGGAVRSEADGPVLDMLDITLTSALEADAGAPTPEEDIVLASTSPALDAPDPRDALPAQSCDVAVTATAAGLGLIDLSVSAPCYPNERLTVHHSGMMITETTGDAGTLDVTVPALADRAVLIVAFANGEGAVAETDVPSLDAFDRVVLQWKGTAGFEVHAREFGADYGADGHIWSGAPGDPVNALAGDGGFLLRLGNAEAAEPLMADIYTFPRAASRQQGEIDLSVEAEVSLFNCGLDIEAQSLELRDGTITARDLVMSVPPCDTIGSFLVLNNLIEDLTVAGK